MFSQTSDRKALASPSDSLTAQEIRARSESNFDLSAGYPELDLPDWLQAIWYEMSLSELRARTAVDAHTWTRSYDSLPAAAAIERLAVERALRLLGIDSRNGAMTRVSYSGSHALDHAAQIVFQASPPTRREVVVPTPTFDVIPAVVRRAGLRPVLAWCEPAASEESFVETALDQVGPQTAALFIVSPCNPFGRTLSAEALAYLLKGCEKAGAILVVDQCFALAGGERAPLLTDVPPQDQTGDWIFLWDTGKTFDLDGERLGFLVTNPGLGSLAQRDFEVLHAELPRRLLLLLAAVMDDPRAAEYVVELNQTIYENFQRLRSALEPVPNVSLEPRGRSVFAILQRHGWNGEELRSRLSDVGVGVVTLASFACGDPRASDAVHNQVRIALCRRPEAFEAAIGPILQALQPASEHQAS